MLTKFNFVSIYYARFQLFALLGMALVAPVQDAQAQSTRQIAATPTAAPGMAMQRPVAAAVAPHWNAAAVERPVKRFTGQQDYMYQTMELKSPVNLPFFPAYRGNGASYTSGLYYPRLKGRQCYVMRFLAKENSFEIMHNYRDSLLQSGWQISAMQTNSKSLTAVKKDSGLYITLSAYPSCKPGFKSSYEIKYLSAGTVHLQ